MFPLENKKKKKIVISKEGYFFTENMYKVARVQRA